MSPKWGIQPKDCKSLIRPSLAQLQSRYEQHLAASASRHPVIFIPPISGSRLDVKLTGVPEVPHWYCSSDSGGWVMGWLSLWNLLPGYFDCFADNLRVVRDANTGDYSSPPGVDVRPGLGFEAAMTPTYRGIGLSVYGCVVQALEQLGWQRNESLASHAYDWRLAPDSFAADGGSYAQLKSQIEALHERSGQRVVGLGLSMGATYFGHFLTMYVDEEWKAQHIEGFISCAGFFGGTPNAAWALVAGMWKGVERFFYRAPFLRLMRGLPALSWLLPDAELFGDAVLVRNTAMGRDYTSVDMGALLKATGATQAAEVWEANRAATRIAAPNVTTFCLYSTNVTTTVQLGFADAAFMGPPQQETSDEGDGTVPLRSLQECSSWEEQQQLLVHTHVLTGVAHAAILDDVEAFNAVLNAIVALHAGGIQQQPLGQPLGLPLVRDSNGVDDINNEK